jgi:hypothetical protein
MPPSLFLFRLYAALLLPLAALVIGCLITSPAWHIPITVTGLALCVAATRATARAVQSIIRQAEERGAHDALTEVVRLGQADPRWEKVSRLQHAAD